MQRVPLLVNVEYANKHVGALRTYLADADMSSVVNDVQAWFRQKNMQMVPQGCVDIDLEPISAAVRVTDLATNHPLTSENFREAMIAVHTFHPSQNRELWFREPRVITIFMVPAVKRRKR